MVVWSVIGLGLGSLPATAQTRREKILADRAKVEAEGFWIYNDLEAGRAQAREAGQPLLVVLRCLPCEQCVKLDEELIEQHPEVAPLLRKYTRVRLVTANHLDLSQFQFDTDQSFAAFLMNADGTIYGRFGTRSDQVKWAEDVSIEGLARALERGLVLHADYPRNRPQLAGKQGRPLEFKYPEDLPLYRGKYGPEINYEGDVVKSCIHCHMVGEGLREAGWAAGGPLAPEVLFPYPHPKAAGLILDPKLPARVAQVVPGSMAAEAGFVAGDDLLSLNGQPLVSIADVQWVLHQVPDAGGKIAVQVSRSGQTQVLEWTLAAGWRRRDDIAWRASTWELRRIGLGGMFLKELDDERRQELKLPAEVEGLYLQHVGQYAPHDRAKRAGVVKGDVLLSFDGRDGWDRETDLLEYALNRVPRERAVQVKVWRQGRRLELVIPAAQ
ncbi:MAG: Trx7/PDZ domain-containing (seleno)protein [Planctomycetaceae bacterium]